MSKYIRTTDGIYEVQKKTDALKKYMPLDTDYIKYNSGIMVAYNVVKKADKIEDLCDVFVSECEVLDHILQNYFYNFDIFKKRWDEGYNAADFYGAIKAKGKGLIYVAKMNAKGEFELCER